MDGKHGAQQQQFGRKPQDRGAGGKGRVPPSKKRMARDAKFGERFLGGGGSRAGVQGQVARRRCGVC